MRRLGSAATALLSVLALAAGCSLAREDDDRPEVGESPVGGAQEDEPTGAVEGELRLAHAAEPQLFRAGGGLALLAVQTSDEGVTGPVVTASYDDGRWSAPEPLSTLGAQASPPHAALNDDGAGAAVWTEQEAGDDGLEASPPVVARVRGADGAWSRREVLDGFAYVEDVQVNARGDVAVYGYPDDGPRRVALHPAGGRWSYSDLEWYDAVSIALDEDGGVHAALTGTERGGGGAVRTQYLPPGGEWTAPEPVETDPAATEAARIVVLPGGGEVLVVGTISPNWQSTLDTQLYWATALQVLARDSRDVPFEETWEKDGATRAQATVHGNSVEIAWLQEADGKEADGAEGPVTVPTKEVLTVAVPGEPEEELAEAPVEHTADDVRGTMEFATGSGCREARAVVWRPVGVEDAPGELNAQVTTGGSSSGAAWSTTGDPVVYGLQGALACAGGDEAWVARVDDAQQAGSADQETLRLTDATVVVAPLG
ncbi:hypothetical protein BJ993_000155 [Nocardioides aromaticivorans]|uniref:Uncharacterized protein n=1 Tax=Nocardioides aromaticivorans TaxID=200618 RepID=A0A7Y9ZFL2_9ACTN|nr:hypothetical protein [Nocardioides aromaticivorans]NYI43075.1 hypothetical protein [Nocardioides aromaticivorans]